VGLPIVACPSVRWDLRRVTFANAWQLFLIFSIIDVLSFGSWMSITEINGFSISPRDRDGDAPSGVLNPRIHA
jgi:hypothetical protein